MYKFLSHGQKTILMVILGHLLLLSLATQKKSTCWIHIMALGCTLKLINTHPRTDTTPQVSIVHFPLSFSHWQYFDEMFPGMDNQSAEGFIFLVSCLHPKSRGQVMVVSSDPRYAPAIDPNYLAHPYDRMCMRDGE